MWSRRSIRQRQCITYDGSSSSEQDDIVKEEETTQTSKLDYDIIQMGTFDDDSETIFESTPSLKRVNSWAFSIDSASIDEDEDTDDSFWDNIDFDMKIADEDDIVVDNTTMNMLCRHLNGLKIDDDSINDDVEETEEATFDYDALDMKIAEDDDIIVENTTMKMLGRHLKGLTQDFKKSGLPWEGYQCRSLLAGGSGVLFALPALIPSATFMFSAQWILQAILSVLADYFHVHHDSVWHGLDRYFATYSLLSSLYWAAGKVDVLAYIVLSPIPIGCYIMASRSKDEMNLAGWKRWHFGWHLTGILEILLVNYLSRHCPEVDSFLAPLCYTS